MSMNSNSNGGSKKRKVNPALLLGGGRNDAGVEADDFSESKKVNGRFGLSGEKVEGSSDSNESLTVGGMVQVPEGKGLLFPGKPVKPIEVAEKPVVPKPVTVKGEENVPARKPVPGFMLPGEVRPRRKPVKVVDEDGGGSLLFPSKKQHDPVEVTLADEDGSSAEGALVDEVEDFDDGESGHFVSLDDEGIADDEVDVEVQKKSAPVPGFMLPGEARPVRKKPVKSEEPVESESSDGSLVEGLDVSDLKPVGRVRSTSSRSVNPLLSTGERELAKPVARPGFFLESDKVSVRKPVKGDESVDEVVDSSVPVVEPVVQPVKKPKRKAPYVSKVEANVEAGEWGEDDEGTSAGLGGEVDVRYTEPQYGKGFHLTERDIIIMRFLARYRYAYVDQLARLVDSIPRNVVNRLRVLEKRGFLRREALTDRQYLWTVRKAGLLLVDSAFREIKKGTLSYATIAHTIGLGSLGVEFEREDGGKDLLGEGKGVEGYVVPSNRWKLGVRGNPAGLLPGEMTVTEREIRQGQMRWRGGRSYKELRELVDSAVADVDAPELEEGMEGLFVVYGPGGKGGEHVPDLVVTRGRDAVGNPNHIAIELELTQKTPTEWRKILRNYRDNGHMYSKVYYFTHKKSIGMSLMKLAEEEGFGDKLVIRKYVPRNNSMPFWG